MILWTREDQSFLTAFELREGFGRQSAKGFDVVSVDVDKANIRIAKAVCR